MYEMDVRDTPMAGLQERTWTVRGIVVNELVDMGKPTEEFHLSDEPGQSVRCTPAQLDGLMEWWFAERARRLHDQVAAAPAPEAKAA